MANHQGLSVRRHQRHEVGLRATLCLSPAAATAIRFSSTSESSAEHIDATLVDIGDGGFGVRTSCFLPRGATISITVHPSQNSDTNGPLLQAQAAIRRVSMTARGPEYLMGMAFTEPGVELAPAVAAVREAASKVAGDCPTRTEDGASA